MIIEKEWDSNVLQMRVGEVRLSDPSDGDSFEQYDYLYSKVSSSNLDRIQYLEDNGFRICAIDVDYVLHLPAIAYKSRDVREFVEDDYADVLNIAKNAFHLDRFHRDHFLSKTSADAIYHAWTTNTCLGKRADKLFVAVPDFRGVLGFSSCIVDKFKGIIDLTAVDFKSVMLGYGNLGTELIRKDIEFFIESGCTLVTTSTQIDNIPSRSVLEMVGFRYFGSNVVLSRGRK